MLNRRFGAHGEYSLSTQGQVLIIRATGPGNLELMSQYITDVEAYVERLSERGKWGTVAVLKGTPLMPPDASRLVEKTIRNEKTIGLKASAIVIGALEFSISATRYWLGIYENANVNAAAFENEAAALDWVKAQIKAE